MTEPIKILIVDDDEEVLIALERTLEGEGYSTATAWSGRDALLLADRIHFDLLLVDENLSDLDATALCEELLRRQPEALPFLLHTRKGGAMKLNSAAHLNVCKWEHNELKAQIRRCLAA
jgi:DNA-binding response OmpR family regulator